MSSIVYRPTASWIQDSHLAQLMKAWGCADYAALQARATAHPEVFWKDLIPVLGIEWTQVPSRILGAGLPHPVWAPGGELSLVWHCIDRHLKNRADQVALIFEADEPGAGSTWTFQDLARESSYVAAELNAAGAKAGDRAALVMPMSPEMVASFFGILRLGMTVVPIFSGYGREAIAARLNDAQISFICVQKKTTRRGKEIPVAATLQELKSHCPSVKKIFEWEREDFKKGHLHQELLPAASRPAESEALLLYTSGTTGAPKACVHTPFGVLATTGKELMFGFDVQESDRFFWYTDIGWMMGPWELLGVLQRGATVVLYEGVPDYPSAHRLWQIMETHRVTHLGISPTAIRVLKKLDDAGPQNCQFKDLRILGSTGEPWDEESWGWYFNQVGKSRCPVINISGGTEIMGCLLMPHLLQPLKPATLGGPALGVHAESWTEEGQPLCEGIGHLVCLSPLPSMTKGFLHSSEKYLQTYFERFGSKVWYHGDWAQIDEEGFWFLKGRSDDTIKIAGKRVGPNEFESVLMEDSRVAEVAAVGLPHELKGESVMCVVVLKQKLEAGHYPALLSELNSRIQNKMGKALMPEKIVFSEALPKTRSGKILRGLIRKIALNEQVDTAAVENPAHLDAVREALKSQ
jgi:acetyl-CoA synthetase